MDRLKEIETHVASAGRLLKDLHQLGGDVTARQLVGQAVDRVNAELGGILVQTDAMRHEQHEGGKLPNAHQGAQHRPTHNDKESKK